MLYVLLYTYINLIFISILGILHFQLLFHCIYYLIFGLLPANVSYSMKPDGVGWEKVQA